ncbi:stimulator of interferon genes protein-like [Pomacea canaliculata]|uniref:stimulator of interferon genes protein-like n=1 Tax=Pomacea canaliculata TaxID=400727 RepID=UPI000D738B1C|nr:stimulator of interferon genes protein-like [Pomacea canaliculata]
MRSDPNYVDKLISMLQGPEVRVNELLPVGNLSYGIVYNYYLGYLRFVLPGIQQRIDRWCQKHSNTQCFDARMSRKFYILVPVSCYCPHTLVDAGCAISFSGHVDDLELSRAGSLRRVYRHTVWSITKPNGQVLHFVGEYPSCLNTLYQMEMIRNTGLDSSERQRQREEFVARLRALLASNDHTDSVRVVDYRDKDSFGNIISLSQVLAPVIEEDRLPPSESQQTVS